MYFSTILPHGKVHFKAIAADERQGFYGLCDSFLQS